MAHLAMLAYVFIALPLLPALVPLAILMLEPRGARLRVAPSRCWAPWWRSIWPS